MIHIHTSSSVPEGHHVRVNRLMPVPGLRNFDPFVLWDHFDISSGGFPAHPHRGFEAITYMFAGGMQHKDNLGNEGTVHAGGAQRFTAGRDIEHSEMPDQHAEGIQLWINLPQRQKLIAPSYQQVEKADIIETSENGIRTSHIVGKQGAIQLQTDVEYLDIHMQTGSSLQREIPSGMRGFIYVLQGELSLSQHRLSINQAALIELETSLVIKAHCEVHLMWCFGQPLHQPIFQHGPFVD
ncbi:MAG: hypothetical protein CO186_01310 [Zetaproteobacteria bacterium CG_4_9_14_3_um_filter_49_83]|nr:MAG: hypothetical protein AUJ56_02640 [Zetaproteobacteria bacterium CG1_02_49_23]PIQ30091.1 MAG: hypothetical protein COW62_13885 [Zetaproteobacteria bacterium CG17_big_fil_post_rev_8_21_14_2_50_50_13]PIV31539.1 MAG: hypothetical protein COS35_01000 [Zetaproteobacteria bacterium CG02_land_8_20_14_3_00_50_9]PIY55961.1 MAG: hypothetical protein COZ00_06390 [Zetaproteobacteria bacterium CG_4_10_14_0_8_um_filter_49_80]PJA36363.1 MAG: hypothetical protein CO186_01310 [Zetaproteobacteria bacterium